MSISVVILTYNEEENLAGCLDSVQWSDDVVVFDSFSSDQTVQIARAHSSRVLQHRFTDYASQRTAALKSVDYRHPWVLMLDADERVPQDLAHEMATAVAVAAEDTTLFRIRRKDHFMGKWLRWSSGYPTWFGRLMRPESIWIEREVNEEYHTTGRIEYLEGHLAHFPFNKGLHHWFAKHNRYSSMEAALWVSERIRPVDVMGLFSRDPTVRRRSAKRFLYRMPARPGIVFTYLFVIRLGFLDGMAGFRFCQLRSMYEKMIDLKLSLEGRAPRRAKET